MAAHRGDLLCCSSALCQSTKSSLAQTMRHASRGKPGTLGGRRDQFREPPKRPAARIRYDVLHPDHWAGLERSLKRGMNRNHQLVRRAFAGLILRDANPAVDDVGTNHFRDIAAALSGIQ